MSFQKSNEIHPEIILCARTISHFIFIHHIRDKLILQDKDSSQVHRRLPKRNTIKCIQSSSWTVGDSKKPVQQQSMGSQTSPTNTLDKYICIYIYILNILKYSTHIISYNHIIECMHLNENTNKKQTSVVRCGFNSTTVHGSSQETLRENNKHYYETHYNSDNTSKNTCLTFS